MFRLANRLGGSITTDEDLSLGGMRGLAKRLEDLAEGDVEAATLPAYPMDGGLRLYTAGARGFVSALQAGEPLPDTGPSSDRSGVDVLVWSGDAPAQADRVAAVLFFYGFAPDVRTRLPIQPLGVEVFSEQQDNGPARWVANVLGVEVSDPPPELDVDREVTVAVGR